MSKPIDEAEARRLVAIGIKRGWLRPAKPTGPVVMGRPRLTTLDARLLQGDAWAGIKKQGEQ